MHIRPRAHREKDRQKERKADEKQKTEDHTHTARSLLFCSAIIFPFCSSGSSTPRSWCIRRLSLFFFFASEGKKNVFKVKKGEKYEAKETHSERDRAPKKKKKRRDITIAFSLSQSVFCFPFGVVVVVVVVFCGEKNARGVRGRRRRLTFRWTERERKKVSSFD